MTLPPASREERGPRRRPALSQDVIPLAAHLLELVTDAVRAASEAHREALDRLARLEHEARVAKQAAEAARVADERAAVVAVEAGKPVSARTHPKALTAADAARRAVPAAEELARGTQFDYITALNADRVELAAAVGAKVAAADAEQAARIDELELLLVQSRGVRTLARELELLHGPGERRAVFGVPPLRPGHDPLKGRTRDLLDALRALAAEAESGNQFVAGA
jgi:hypothetical protein